LLSVREAEALEGFLHDSPCMRLLVCAPIAAGFLAGSMACAIPDKAAVPDTAAGPSERSLRVCADPNNLPFSNEKGAGFENKIAELIAAEMHARLEYVWWAQRRGFVRNTLRAGLCDVVMGMPADLEMAATTRPYYRSAYVFVTRAGEHVPASLDDRRLQHAIVGVHLIGDDAANTPPAHALSARGIVDNVRGYSIYGNYAEPDPPARLIRAVADHEIDVAIAWGPLAGYFASRSAVPLQLHPLTPREDPRYRFEFDIAMGVARENAPLRDRLNTIIDAQRDRIEAILRAYGVPLISAGAAGAVYVTNEDSGDLSVIDPATQTVTALIHLGKRPRGIALSPDRRTLYVALSGSPRAGPGVDERTLPPPDRSADGIGVVDLDAHRLVRVLPSGSDPEQVAVSHDGSLLFVANEDAARASVIDVNTGAIKEAFTVGGEPEGIAVQPNADRFWVTSEAAGNVSVIDWSTHRLVGSVPVGPRPRNVAFLPNGARAYVPAENGATITVIDTSSLKVLRTIALGNDARAMGVVVSPDGSRLYVTTGRSRNLLIIDTATGAIMQSLAAGARPWGIALDPAAGVIYTANGPSNDVSMIDIKRRQVVAKIEVGGNPWGAIFVPPR
jgi:quinoprotein dehydrogenase-associated probable ABC transporter substrate-binding protein